MSTGVVTEFQDVAADGVHTPAIKALAAQGVFADTECDESRFCPDEPMQRWVMAIWMIRLLGAEPPAIGTSRFDDIADGQWWIRHAEQLADRGITIGCDTDPPRYCPNKTVTRAQMATFLVRALKLEPAAPSRVRRHPKQHPPSQHRRPLRRRHHQGLRHRPAPLLPQPASDQSTNGHLPQPSPPTPATRNLNPTANNVVRTRLTNGPQGQ